MNKILYTALEIAFNKKETNRVELQGIVNARFPRSEDDKIKVIIDNLFATDYYFKSVVKSVIFLPSYDLFELTENGKRVFITEKNKRHKQIERDEINIKVKKSTLINNRFIWLIGLALIVGMIFQMLNYLVNP